MKKITSILLITFGLTLNAQVGNLDTSFGDNGKIGVGAWLAATANLILVVAIVSSGGEPIHPLWPALYCAGLGVAFLYYWPTLLALVSRAAPAPVLGNDPLGSECMTHGDS